jgi:hypothetical protein
VPSEKCSIEEKSIDYCGWTCLFLVHKHNVTRHNTHIHNIPSTAPQLSISQKVLGTVPEGGNAMTKLVGTTIHN